MNNISVLRSLITRLENLLVQLRSQHEVKDIDNLRLKFNTLRKEYNAFARLTNYGKATVELRVKNLKKLKAWLEAYSGEQHEEMMFENIPKKYKKEKVIVDVSTLEKYKEYAQLALDYLSDLAVYFPELKTRVAPILATGEVLNKKLKYFKLNLEDFPGTDELLADDEEEEIPEDLTAIAPLQMIRSIGAILKNYGKFIKKVEDKTTILEPLVQELEQVDLEELFNQLNEYNNSVKAMVTTLVSINKVIKESDFTFKLAFQEKYRQLVRECLPYLPTEIATEFQLKLDDFEQEIKEKQTLGRSVGKPKTYDPLRDPAMKWPKSPKPKEYSPVYPETLQPYEEEEDLDLPDPLAGEPITPEEKEKYEALWEAAASRDIQIKKVAKYLKNKYNFA